MKVHPISSECVDVSRVSICVGVPERELTLLSTLDEPHRELIPFSVLLWLQASDLSSMDMRLSDGSLHRTARIGRTYPFGEMHLRRICAPVGDWI